jgi:uncharacterized membrane protein
MLVPLSLGVFVCAAVFDVADLAGGPALLGTVGYWTAVGALAAAAVVAAAGMAELWDLPPCSTRRTVLIFHAVNLAMALLFLLGCLVRAQVPNRGANGGVVVLELLAVAIGAAGVQVGARLVRQFDEARTDATSFDALRSGTAEAGGVATPREQPLAVR